MRYVSLMRTQNSWLLRIDGLQPFLTKSIDLPRYAITSDGTRCYAPSRIVIYDAMGSGAQVDALAGKPTLGDVNVEFVDGGGRVTERLRMKNVRVLNVDRGGLDYANPEPNLISLMVSYDGHDNITANAP